MVLALYGASGLGLEYCEFAGQMSLFYGKNKYSEYIFVDDDSSKAGTLFDEKKVFTFEGAAQTYGIENIEFLISVGEPDVKDVIFKKLKDNNCKMASLIYKEEFVPKSAKLGEGIIAKRFTSIPPRCVVGNNVLIQAHSALGHNTVLGDNVVISSFAFVGGDTVIGKNAYIGPHACLRNGIKIGENAVIGMGAVVTKDIPDNAVAYGNPAKVMRYNEKNRVFSK